MRFLRKVLTAAVALTLIAVAVSPGEAALRGGKRVAVMSGASFIPKIDGARAVISSDFVASRYSYLGRKLYSFPDWLAVLGGSFSSSPNGTRINAAGLVEQAVLNTPRVDYDPATLVSRGVRFESQRTNVCLWSRDLTNAAWTASNVTVAKDQVGADGAANAASSLTATAGNGTVLQAITLGSSARFQSAYVKRLTGTGTVNMTMDNGATWTAIVPTASWSALEIPTQTLANPTVGFQIVTSGDAIAVDYVQNENGVFRSSAIPTTSALVLRTAEIFFVPATVGWFNDGGPGTALLQFSTPDTASAGLISFYQIAGPATNSLEFFLNANANFSITTSGAGQGTQSRAITVGSSNKVISAWATDDFIVAGNGTLSAGDTAAALPTGVDRMGLGTSRGAINQLNGTMAMFAYWPRRGSNPELQRSTAP